MTQIIPGIYQLELPLPVKALKYVNIYLIQGDSECILVDTGLDTEEAFDSLKKQLAEIGVGFKDITQIVATHVHGDHYGMAAKLREVCQAKISLHRLEKVLLETRHPDRDKWFQMIDRWFRLNGAPPFQPAEFQAVPQTRARSTPPPLPDITLQDGEPISISPFDLQVLWTPGHSPGHISLFERTHKLLFSGDFILPTITPNVSLRPQDKSNPLADFINSLNRVRQLDVRLVLPAHGKPFVNLEQRVEELLQHHQQRNLEILDALDTKAKTAYQIATEISWMLEKGGVDWQDLAPLDKRMAVLETLAHLEYLKLDEKTDKFTRDDIIYYQHI